MEMASKILGQLAIWRIDSKNFIQPANYPNRVLKIKVSKSVFTIFTPTYDKTYYDITNKKRLLLLIPANLCPTIE